MRRVLTRWPPLTWLLVYVGSLLVLMGSQVQHLLVVGMCLLLAALGVAVWLAAGRDPERPRPPGLFWTLGGLAAFYVVSAIAAAQIGWEFAVAALLGGIVPMTAAALVFATIRRKMRAEGGRLEDESIEDHSPFPGVGMDDATPLGDTPDVHSEISPHDLPKDHPGRREAERFTREPEHEHEPERTTRGNR